MEPIDPPSAAQMDSERLKNMMLRAFERFEKTHGLQPDEGRILLMDTGLKHRRRAA